LTIDGGIDYAHAETNGLETVQELQQQRLWSTTTQTCQTEDISVYALATVPSRQYHSPGVRVPSTFQDYCTNDCYPTVKSLL